MMGPAGVTADTRELELKYSVDLPCQQSFPAVSGPVSFHAFPRPMERKRRYSVKGLALIASVVRNGNAPCDGQPNFYELHRRLRDPNSSSRPLVLILLLHPLRVCLQFITFSPWWIALVHCSFFFPPLSCTCTLSPTFHHT